MGTLKYFLADYFKHKARVYQLNFIGAFIKANVNIEVLLSCTVYMDNTFQNIVIICNIINTEEVNV